MSHKTIKNHTNFLQSTLWENSDNFADVKICCSDGTVHQNGIFLCIVDSLLQTLPEFTSPDLDVLVIFPDYTLHQYFEYLKNNLFSSRSEDNMTYSANINATKNNILSPFWNMNLPENIENMEIIMNDDAVEHSLLEKNFEKRQPDLIKKYKCHQCEKSFSRKKALVVHKYNSHNIQDPAYKDLETCNICFLKFEAPVQLRKHLRSHSKSKPFKCEICKKHFVSKSNLTTHKRLHDGTALRYECTQCEKKFSHPSEVKQHMVVHTGIRAYSCKQCGNKYGRYPSLWKHMQKCTFNKNIILVQPIKYDNPQVDILSHHDTANIEAFSIINNKPLLLDSEDSRYECNGSYNSGSVVVDEIVVTDNIGDDIILPADTFQLESI